AREVEDVHLERHGAAGAESRIDAQAGGRRQRGPAVDAGGDGVDPLARQELVREAQVGRGHADLAPAAGAAHDLAVDIEITTEQESRPGDVPLEEELADLRR